MTMPIVLLLRTRDGKSLLAGVIGFLVLAVLTPTELVSVPFRNQVTNQFPPLLACLPGVLLTVALYSPDPELERSSARPMPLIRAGLLAALLTGLGMAVFVAFLPNQELGRIGLRNHLLISGISLVTAVLLPRALAWFPGAVYAGAVWLYGTVDLTGRPNAWALLLRPSTERWPWFVALSAFVLGSIVWTLRDGKVSS